MRRCKETIENDALEVLELIRKNSPWGMEGEDAAHEVQAAFTVAALCKIVDWLQSIKMQLQHNNECNHPIPR